MLAPSGLRTTQFSILAKLRRLGSMTINALAAEMVMDRTTLGRNILPLERDGLIAVEQGSHDRRSKELRVTEAGQARFRAGVKGCWRSREEVKFAADSPLEGGVYCELVSEVGFRRVANKARFQGVYG